MQAELVDVVLDGVKGQRPVHLTNLEGVAEGAVRLDVVLVEQLLHL